MFKASIKTRTSVQCLVVSKNEQTKNHSHLYLYYRYFFPFGSVSSSECWAITYRGSISNIWKIIDRTHRILSLEKLYSLKTFKGLNTKSFEDSIIALSISINNFPPLLFIRCKRQNITHRKLLIFHCFLLNPRLFSLKTWNFGGKESKVSRQKIYSLQLYNIPTKKVPNLRIIWKLSKIY